MSANNAQREKGSVPFSRSKIGRLFRKPLAVMLVRHDIDGLFTDEINQSERPIQYFTEIVVRIFGDLTVDARLLE